MTPSCCDVPMWLNSLEEIELRGGDLELAIEDAIAWECLDCDRTILVAWL